MVLTCFRTQRRRRAIDKLWYASLIVVPRKNQREEVLAHCSEAVLASLWRIQASERPFSAPCSFETCLWHPDPHHRKPAAGAVEGATCNLPRYRRLGQNGSGQRKPDGRLVLETMQILVRKKGIDNPIGC